jgi:predicted aspartyl protease
VSNITFGLQPNGSAMLEILVGVTKTVADALSAGGKTIPPPLRMLAMIDTGATDTCVPPGTASKLGVTIPTGMKSYHTAKGPSPCPTFALGVYLPNHRFFRELVVAELPPDCIQTHALIGCDLLATGMLVYNGSTRTFTLAF